MTVSKAYLITEKQRDEAIQRLEALKSHLSAYTEHLPGRTDTMKLYDRNFDLLLALFEGLPTRPLYSQVLEHYLGSAPSEVLCR